MLCKDFVSTICTVSISTTLQMLGIVAYLVDTAHTETESATLDPRAIHVISDKQNQL